MKNFLIKCKEAWQRWNYLENGDYVVERQTKNDCLKVFLIVFIYYFCVFLFGFFLQAVLAQETYTLTIEEMSELENLLENLKGENRMLMTKRNALKNLVERLKEALEKRTISLNALQTSYDEYERETKILLHKMNHTIQKQEEKIKSLKKIILRLTISLIGIVLIFLVLSGVWLHFHKKI